MNEWKKRPAIGSNDGCEDEIKDAVMLSFPLLCIFMHDTFRSDDVYCGHEVVCRRKLFHVSRESNHLNCPDFCTNIVT
jgi:hypothetical protein